LEGLDQVPALPTRQRSDISDDSGQRIERAGTADTDALEVPTHADGLMQGALDAVHRAGKSIARFGRKFSSKSDASVVAHGTHSDLGPAYVDCSNQSHVSCRSRN
jgi:hypothetical protein